MELKQIKQFQKYNFRIILIEPVGIETDTNRLDIHLHCILIEPVGIETTFKKGQWVHANKILIEPVGIETGCNAHNCK